jgi:hypothetical protein
MPGSRHFVKKPRKIFSEENSPRFCGNPVQNCRRMFGDGRQQVIRSLTRLSETLSGEKTFPPDPKMDAEG